jgi:hypothetical protein
MRVLGVSINASKSLSSTSKVFEFAKRTIWETVNVSTVSLQQILSATSIGAKVANAATFARMGLINTVPHLAIALGGASPASFRKLKEVGLPAISLLNLLFSQEIVELRIVLGALVNPRFEDFD